MTLGSTQPLTEMSIRSLSWRGKDGRCVGMTTLPPSYADCLRILGASTSWSPRGLSRPVQGQLYLYELKIKSMCTVPDGDKSSSLRPARFDTEEKSPGAPWIQAGWALYSVRRPCPWRESNHSSTVQPGHYSDCAILTLHHDVYQHNTFYYIHVGHVFLHAPQSNLLSLRTHCRVHNRPTFDPIASHTNSVDIPTPVPHRQPTHDPRLQCWSNDCHLTNKEPSADISRETRFCRVTPNSSGSSFARQFSRP
jgi:hypothetical protein